MAQRQRSEADGVLEENHATARSSANHCLRYSNCASDHCRANRSEDLSDRNADRWAADTSHAEGTGKMLVEGLAKRGYKLGENLAYAPAVHS
jgi:hypothetical protein